MYDEIIQENDLNEKADGFAQNIKSLDYDACLMSQRMAVADNPSGLVKVKNLTMKDHS